MTQQLPSIAMKAQEWSSREDQRIQLKEEVKKRRNGIWRNWKDMNSMQSFVILRSFLQWRWQWASIGHFVFLFPQKFTPRDAHCFWQWAFKKSDFRNRISEILFPKSDFRHHCKRCPKLTDSRTFTESKFEFSVPPFFFSLKVHS